MERNTNVFQFQGSKMIVSAKGPSTNFTNKNFTMDTSCRPNLFSSTLNMPWNFQKQSSAASVASSQRSIYHRRDTSPTASIRSDLQPRNFHQPFYPRGFSQQSVYNDRAVSPVSMRSIGSTASRADTIKSYIDAIECCTEDELKIIKHKIRHLEYRKKAQKRRKMQISLKNFQKRYEDDSEQGSSSSISNDDCVSTQTGYSWRQFSQRNGLLQNENTLYSQNNTMCGPKNTFFSQKYTSGEAKISSMQRNTLNASIWSTKSMQNITMMSQRDRFTGGFQFPSQKFNRSTLYEEQHPVRSKQFLKADCANNKKMNVQRAQIEELSDENDNIFLDTTEKQRTVVKKSEKRKAESLSDIPNPTSKKPKTCLNNEKVKKQTQNIFNTEKNEFEFVKPQFPVKKSAPAKPREKMISKSSGIPDLLSSTQENEILQPQPVQAPSPEPHVEPEQQDNPGLTTSDMSMRPSFMKRKLFTQTLDVTERKNNSFDSGSADSPQSNIYSALSREKHKTRKLVTSQALLSRDVNQDDDNLLDLIHKIVPPNQVNSTITANTTKPRVSGTKNGDYKWDITSIISTCNNDSVSETYTDDEIFRVSIDDTKSKPQEKPVSKKNNNKLEVKNSVANITETKKAENNVNPINDKNVKDIVNASSKSSRYLGNIKLQSDRNVKNRGNANQINKNNTKDVDNIKTTNNKNIKKNIEESKLTKIVKEVDDIKLANNKNVKDVDNMKTTNNNNIKDVDEIKLTNNKIFKNVGVEKLLNSKRVVSRNPLSNKKCKDLDNKHNKNNKDVKRMLQAAIIMDAPVKPCPTKRVMLSRSRIDAFWDTDDSDHESAAARAHWSPVLEHHHTDLAQNYGINPKQSAPDTPPTSSTKVIITNKAPASIPIVVLQDTIANQTQSKTKKKPDVNSQPEKTVKNNNGTPNTSLRSRRLINRSAALESANHSDLKENDTSLKENIPPKTKVQKKQEAEKKKTQDKNTKTKADPKTKITNSRNKKENDSLIDNSKKRVETSKRHCKTSKVQKPADQIKIDLCKVLRSRNIDLSSSFNSDKFELTMTRTRKSRTPSKIISFNKSRNVLANNKIRSRATKS
ncbi:putative uncharacterized protein DDB_G0282133 [Cydia pomonella]|uniref:putative uncharacterized protein DDB_G0282133 n=1 Tax=Cydia pomonella TaxID=82600 RepID=UPI002ADE79D2|nr:putative uncharacterized protein DDB_G0282133 [Cydia pomonella]